MGNKAGKFKIINNKKESPAFGEPVNILRKELSERETLSKITKFTVDEIDALRIKFDRISSQGVMTPQVFANSLCLNHKSELLKAIFQSFDVTNDEELNFREFVVALSAMSSRADLDTKIRFSFDIWDLNRDGHIDAFEMKRLLLSATSEGKLSLTEKEIDDVVVQTIRELDIDGDGKIDFKEYETMVKARPEVLAPLTVDLQLILTPIKSGLHRRLSSGTVQVRTEKFEHQSNKSSRKFPKLTKKDQKAVTIQNIEELDL